MEIKPFELTNGTVMLTTNASAGIYNSAQLKLIASLCDNEVALVKATEDQRLAICVAKEHVDAVTSQLESVGLGVSHFKSGIIQPSACLGELCPKHQQDALGAAIDIGEQLSSLSVPSQLKIGINGCADCCVPCHTNEISIIGESEGYRISVGGKGSQIPELSTFVAEAVPAEELAKRVKDIIAVYGENAEPNETFQEYIERSGIQKIVEVLSPYSSEATSSSSSLEASDDKSVLHPESETEQNEFRIEDLSDIEILPAEDDQNFDLSPNGSNEDFGLDMAQIEVNPIESEPSEDENIAAPETEEHLPSKGDLDETAVQVIADNGVFDSEPLMIEDEVPALKDEPSLISNEDFQDQITAKPKLSLVDSIDDSAHPERNRSINMSDQVKRCEFTDENQVRIQFQSGAQLELKGMKSREIDFSGKSIKVQYKGSLISVEVDDLIFSYPMKKVS
jgi:dissimilatory sulfite reductase (desulfoviridin) alpha/beta subunit